MPKALHCDNGAEFHSAAFRRGCDLTKIDAHYRPPGTLRFGGPSERRLGTFTHGVRLLPGNGYSAILGRQLRDWPPGDEWIVLLLNYSTTGW